MKFADLVGCDVLVLVRTLAEESIRALRIAKRLGKKVIYFVDDNFLRIAEDFEPKVVKQLMGDERTLRHFKSLVSESDLVVVASEGMASEIRSIAHTVHVLPANIRERYIRGSVSPRRDSDKLTIGHVGTGYRKKEFEFLAPAIKTIAKKLEGKARLEFWGMNVSKVVPPVTYRPFLLDYVKYLNDLCSAGFDILLTPLLDTPYRNCKSYVKYLETAAAGAAGIYSNTPVFGQIVKNEETGLLVANNSEDWTNAILRLAEDTELRRRIVEKSREDVLLSYTTEATTGRFNGIFDTIQPEYQQTCSSLLLKIGDLVDRQPDLLLSPGTLGSFPGAKLLRAGQIFHSIETMLVWGDRVCEIGARLLRIGRK